ncbi:hypothetical protein SeLEV6574_g00765 [Synchytrium endobioticum]|uniref:Uncharacterized protein n=1 Tax=Synchytrium endobioticum TaxID=286115 RepID=A0A507DGK1_9FUNG|nr:hypothetical protein SeLEV6574_g00765 [Synchytrium endobioticum]
MAADDGDDDDAHPHYADKGGDARHHHHHHHHHHHSHLASDSALRHHSSSSSSSSARCDSFRPYVASRYVRPSVAAVRAPRRASSFYDDDRDPPARPSAAPYYRPVPASAPAPALRSYARPPAPNRYDDRDRPPLPNLAPPPPRRWQEKPPYNPDDHYYDDRDDHRRPPPPSASYTSAWKRARSPTRYTRTPSDDHDSSHYARQPPPPRRASSGNTDCVRKSPSTSATAVSAATIHSHANPSSNSHPNPPSKQAPPPKSARKTRWGDPIVPVESKRLPENAPVVAIQRSKRDSPDTSILSILSPLPPDLHTHDSYRHESSHATRHSSLASPEIPRNRPYIPSSDSRFSNAPSGYAPPPPPRHARPDRLYYPTSSQEHADGATTTSSHYSDNNSYRPSLDHPNRPPNEDSRSLSTYNKINHSATRPPMDPPHQHPPLHHQQYEGRPFNTTSGARNDDNPTMRSTRPFHSARPPAPTRVIAGPVPEVFLFKWSQQEDREFDAATMEAKLLRTEELKLTFDVNRAKFELELADMDVNRYDGLITLIHKEMDAHDARLAMLAEKTAKALD